MGVQRQEDKLKWSKNDILKHIESKKAPYAEHSLHFSVYLHKLSFNINLYTQVWIILLL